MTPSGSALSSVGPSFVSTSSMKKGTTKSINPWSVDSIQDFYIIKCPECEFNTGIKEENSFQNHAVENHPMSFAFFGSLSDNSGSPIKKHLRLENGASSMGTSINDVRRFFFHLPTLVRFCRTLTTVPI